MTDQHSLQTLPRNVCWTHLRSSTVGRLGVNVGRQPDIFPVNYVIDDNEIVIRTQPGTKLASAIMGQNVAFEIDGFDHDARQGWSVVVHGIARESRLLGDATHDAELPIDPWAPGEKTRHLRIKPTKVTGRSITDAESAIMEETEET